MRVEVGGVELPLVLASCGSMGRVVDTVCKGVKVTLRPEPIASGASPRVGCAPVVLLLQVSEVELKIAKQVMEEDFKKNQVREPGRVCGWDVGRGHGGSRVH